jgi:hypothetical protein
MSVVAHTPPLSDIHCQVVESVVEFLSTAMVKIVAILSISKFLLQYERSSPVLLLAS